MSPLRSSYSAEEFAAEIMDGKRTPSWVRKQARLGKIKTTARRPWVIPASEAERFRGNVSRAA